MKGKSENQEVVDHILSLYRLDKLCTKCGGPIEINNLNTCNNCDFLLNLKVQLDMVETCAMTIRYKSGLGRPPVNHVPKTEAKKSLKKAPRKRKQTKKKTNSKNK